MPTLTTAWKLGSVVTQVMPGAYGWTNRNNVLSDSDADAFTSSLIEEAPAGTFHLRVNWASQFAEVPANAMNPKLNLLVSGRYSDNPCSIAVVKMNKTTSIPAGNNKAGPTALTTSFADYQFGGDAWGLTLAVADLASLYAWVQVVCEEELVEATTAIRHIYASVTYDVPESGAKHRTVGAELCADVYKQIDRVVR